MYFKEEKFMKLENGEFLINMFGKFLPDMIFIVPNEDAKSWDDKFVFSITKEESLERFNIKVDSNFKIYYGDSWISKNKKRIFKLKSPEEAKEILIEYKWGRSPSKGRGGHFLTLPEASYSRRVGGRSGVDYTILPKDFKYEETE